MNDILTRIKRAILKRQFAFSDKATTELESDCLTRLDALESIVNAVGIHKTLRSRSLLRGQPGEKLYVIISPTLDGIELYTKGKLVKENGQDVFYFMISAKRAN